MEQPDVQRDHAVGGDCIAERRRTKSLGARQALDAVHVGGTYDIAKELLHLLKEILFRLFQHLGQEALHLGAPCPLLCRNTSRLR